MRAVTDSSDLVADMPQGVESGCDAVQA
jgi:hypothetical protein